MPPLRYFIPNTFTALSLLLGLASVVLSSRGEFDLAAWMILWGTLLDKADGTAARLCNATSDFGVQFDSFADFVAFGIAPAALFYFYLTGGATSAGGNQLNAAIACGLYALALAIRLARFNITTDDGDTQFVGIPGTLLGAVLASGFLAFRKYGLPQDALVAIPPVLLFFAFLMVSNVRLPKLKPRKSKLLNLFQGANVAAAYILGPMRLFPEYLFGLAITYLTVGMVVGRLSPSPAAPDVEQQEA